MKKIIAFLFIVLLISQLTGCEKNKIAGETDMLYSNINIEPSLEKCLTTSYKLEDLQSYFGRIPPNEDYVYNSDKADTKITMEDVDDMFPLTCTRNTGLKHVYSVYSVAEGGYYYVFWSIGNFDAFDLSTLSEKDYIVCFSTYIRDLPQVNDFDSIILNQSTAVDVSGIDESVEISFLLSSGVYSFSLLKDGSVAICSYHIKDRYSSRADLLVKDVRILPRSEVESASYLSLISESDLPKFD